MSSYRDKLKEISIEELLAAGTVVLPQDKKSEELVETLSTLTAIEEADKVIQDLFKNGDLQVEFEDVFQQVEKLAKQEFTLKHKLLQLTKA